MGRLVLPLALLGAVLADACGRLVASPFVGIQINPWGVALLGAGCGAAIGRLVRRRPPRARAGSVLARADQRASAGAFAVAAAIASLPAVVVWPFARGEPGIPWFQVAAVAVGVVGCVVELVAARAARRAFAAVAASLGEARELPDEAAPTLDLGIGDARRARLVGSFSYRGAEREAELVVGDVAIAAAALARSARVAGARVVLALLVLAAHAVAATPWVELEAATRLCARGRMASCHVEGMRLEERGDPAFVTFSRRACEEGYFGSCAVLADHGLPTYEAVARTRALLCGDLPLRGRHADRMRVRRRAERGGPPLDACTAQATGELPPVDGDACPAGMALVPGHAAPFAVQPVCVDREKIRGAAWLRCPVEVCGRPETGEHCDAPDTDAPVNCITHAQAERYCAWRGARLPTLDEWETITHDSFRSYEYPFASAPPDPPDCWTGVCAARPAATTPEGVTVGGNVWTSTAKEGGFHFAGGSPRSLMSTRPWSPDVGVQCVELW